MIDMEEQLIVEVEKRPILYNKNLKTYKHLKSRLTAWKEVADALHQTDVEAVKKRWTTLRDAFVKHYRAFIAASNAPGFNRKKEWIYLQDLMYLAPHVEFKDPSTLLNHAQEDSLLDEDNEEDDVEENEILENLGVDMNLSQVDISNKSTPNNISLKRKRDENEKDPLTIDEKLLNIITKDPDSDKQFMLSCVPFLKRLAPRNNQLVRIKIQQLLFEAAYGTEDNQEFIQ